MELPLSVVRAGAERVTLSGKTRNISSSGVLFVSGTEPYLGDPIEYVITLNHEGAQAISLRCIGKVLRSERCQPSTPSTDPVRFAYTIAATLERYEFVRELQMNKPVAVGR